MTPKVTPDSAPDLSQLRDIHLPSGVSWWPLAIGWWILIGLVLLGTLAAFLLYRRKRANRWRRMALQELESIRANQTQPERNRLSELSVLLRRVAISRFPRTDVASLHGDSWLAFLDRTLGEDEQFRSGKGKLLSIGPYADSVRINAEELATLFALAEKWIRKLSHGATP